MGKWKLNRESYGTEEYSLAEGDMVTIGRGIENTITLSSLVISRQHCVICVSNDKITVKDLKSSNGTYVGANKITPYTEVEVTDNEIIGIGWSDAAPSGKLADTEKYMFKLTKEIKQPDIPPIEDQVENYYQGKVDEKSVSEDIEINNCVNSRLSLKRKSESLEQETKENNVKIEMIDLLSDSDTEVKKPKKSIRDRLDSIIEEPDIKPEVKHEVQEDEYFAFTVKQELHSMRYDEEPINLDSDSETEEERRWLIRLSQSSPGKPQSHVSSDIKSSYRDQDDSVMGEDYDYEDDFIKIPILPELNRISIDVVDNHTPAHVEPKPVQNEIEQVQIEETVKPVENEVRQTELKDKTDSIKQVKIIEAKILSPSRRKSQTSSKVQPPWKQTKEKAPPKLETTYKVTKSKGRSKRTSPQKIDITNSQKEERKRKLKEIANKDKKQELENASSSAKSSVNIKVTSKNRGAFLTEVPIIDEDIIAEPKSRKKRTSRVKTNTDEAKSNENEKSSGDDSKSKDRKKSTQSKKSETDCKDQTKSKDKTKSKDETKIKDETKTKNETKSKDVTNSKEIESRVPLKNLRPLSQNDSMHGKPMSKVEPMSNGKPKKRVTFSTEPPKVKIFEIEPGNQLKKTSLVKATLLDVPQEPVFSLEKQTLMKVLRWNPYWLSEQENNNEPPPILGHNKPINVLHYFKNHMQYLQVVGDLLLMEIWECLTQAHKRTKHLDFFFKMSIENLPPPPPFERVFEIFNLSVNVSVPRNNVKTLPRIGEIMIVTFGATNQEMSRFFYVHNVRSLPAPQNNMYAYFSISLHTVYTDKMKHLHRGEVIHGKVLSYIRNELSLFEAMDYMSRSPLSEIILRPNPIHFRKDIVPHDDISSRWTATLNQSQLQAVSTTVAAALRDRPSLQMIQGPPGTGKSSVICSIIMTYFYDMAGNRRQNRGKVLVCATSNAAVDELVIRLINIRQSLPNGRFRMVRVGRCEAMHPRARNLCSQSLAERDLLAKVQEPNTHLKEELCQQEARLNMWKSMVLEAKDPARLAYCQSRINLVTDRIQQLRCGTAPGADISAELMAATEKRIIEGADIVVTTLSSTANHKMRGLKRRIAFCIVDEAGQAIEPETLIPLMLDVSKITLIGDPQQLPGYICSQRAKKYGLGDSLFSRLSASMENWDETNPIVLLNTQYRMNPSIADYPNRAFYGGLINNAYQPMIGFKLPSYAVVKVSSGNKGQESTGDFFVLTKHILTVAGANEMEAWAVSRLVLAIHNNTKHLNLSIAVITPYNAHKDMIKRNLRVLQDANAPQVEVNTVDSFQGQERDVVVVSLARSQGVGFLTDAGRMNVMLTRAKHALYICLNPYAVMKNPQWKTLIEDAQIRNLYRHLPNSFCQAVTQGQCENDDILKCIITN